jgi:NTP pyrophosphatase (non-canonical NTP hydrolase)
MCAFATIPAMADSTATISELKQLIKQFRDERDWEQFHDPKNLAEGLIIEAGELLEHFLWKDKEQIAEQLKNDPTFREEIGDELADVINYALLLSMALNMDVEEITKRKIEKTKIKYPVEKSKGSAAKYTKFQ